MEEQQVKIKHSKMPTKLSSEIVEIRNHLEVLNESLNDLYTALSKVEDDLEKVFVRVDILEVDEEA